MNLLKTICLILAVSLVGCKNQEKSPNESMTSVIQSSLGDSYEKIPQDGYAIYLSKQENGSVSFVISDEEKKTITYGPEKIIGFVEWHDKMIVKVRETPEVIEDKNSQQSFIYYLNAKTGKRTTLNPK